MAETLGSLVVELGANVAHLQTDMARAVGIVEKGAAAMRGAVELAAKAFAALGAGFAIGDLASTVNQMIDLGDTLKDLSKATGTSVEQLSFFQYAAKQSGTDVDTLSGAVLRLQRNLADVVAGGGAKAADALHALGLTAKNLANTDLLGQLTQVGDGLDKIQNPSQRAQIGMALFGKQYKAVASLLSEGRDGIGALAQRFAELNGVVTTEQAEKFDAYNDAIENLGISFRGLGKAIGESLTGNLTQFIESLASSVAQIPTLFGAVVSQMTVDFLKIDLLFTQIDLKIAKGKNFLFGGLQGEIERRTAEAAALQGQIDSVQRNQAQAEENARGVVAGVRKTITQTPTGTITDDLSTEAKNKLAAAAERLAKAEADYLNSLERAKVAQQEATELARVQVDITSGAAAKFDEATKARALQLADEVDRLRETAQVHEYLLGITKERQKADEAAARASNEQRAAAIEALKTPLEKYIDDINKLRDLNLDQTNFSRGVEAANKRFIDARNELNKVTGAAHDLGLTFSSAFEDAIVGAKSLGDVVRGLFEDIARIATRSLVTEPLSKALQGFFSGSGGGGGALASIGSFISGLFHNDAGGLYKVGGSSGEHPVAFTARAGEVVAVGHGTGGGGVTVNVYNNSDSQVSQRYNPSTRALDVFVESSLTRRIASGGGRALGLQPALAAR